MKRIIAVLAAIFLTLSSPSPILAADVDVICTTSSCTPTVVDPFFSPSEIWYPGKSVAKTINVTNNSGFNRFVKARAENTNTTGEIDKVMQMVIKNNSNNQILWSGTLNTFYSLGNIFLAEVTDTTQTEFGFTVTMDLSAGNQYQGKSTSFNMIFNFNQSPNFPTLTPTQAPLPSATPTSTPEPTVSASSIPSSTPSPQPSATSAPGPTSTPGPGPTSTPGPAPSNTPVPTATPTASVFGGPFTSIVASIEYLPADSPTPTTLPGEVLGAGEAPMVYDCQNPWWILVLMLEAIISGAIVRFAKREKSSRYLFAQTLVTTICLFVLAQFFCLWWPILLVGCLGTLGIILIYLKPLSPSFPHSAYIS